MAVAETRHFGRAAERCFVSQPTLSGQLKKLEEELGVTLFERTSKTVAITPVGESLLVHARRAVQEADALVQVARAHRDPLAGPLRVGVIPTLSPYLIPLILLPLRRQHPQLRLVLSEDLTEVLLERLRAYAIDVAIIATPVDDPELVARPMFEEPFWLAHPRDHPLYYQDPITRADLVKLDLLLLADGHCLARQVSEVCQLAEGRAGELTADLRASSLETLLQLVGAGLGCTLVPALAVRGAWTTDAGVVARPIEVPDAFRRVSLTWRRSFPRQPAVDALSRVIVQNLPNTVRPLPPAPGATATG